MRQAVECRIDGLLFEPVTPAGFMEQACCSRRECVTVADGSRDASSQSARAPTMSRSVAAERWPSIRGCWRHAAHPDAFRGAAGGDVNVRTAEAQRAAGQTRVRQSTGSAVSPKKSRRIRIIEAAITSCARRTSTRIVWRILTRTMGVPQAHAPPRARAERLLLPVAVFDRGVPAQPFRRHSDYKNAKLQAIGAYKSQVDRHGVASGRRHRVNGAGVGWYAGHTLAEPMRIVRQRDSEMKHDIANGA